MHSDIDLVLFYTVNLEFVVYQACIAELVLVAVVPCTSLGLSLAS